MTMLASVQDLANITAQPVRTVQGTMAIQFASARIVTACGTDFSEYPAVPDDVRACCLQLAAEQIAAPDGITFERIDDYSYRRPDPDKTAGAAMLAALVARYGPAGVYMVTVTEL
jgi:hypothetical protein